MLDITEKENIECIINLTRQLGDFDLLIYNGGYEQKIRSYGYQTAENTNSITATGFEKLLSLRLIISC